MTEAMMKLVKIMSTVRVAVAFTSFTIASAIFFVTSSVPSVVLQAPERGGAAQWPPREGSAETAKLRGPPENRVFRKVNFLTGLLSKSRLQFYFVTF